VQVVFLLGAAKGRESALALVRHCEASEVIADIFERAGAVKVVTSETLAGELRRLLDDAGARQELGRRAAEVVRQQRGATERTLNELDKLLTVPVRMGQHEHVAT